MRLHLRTGALRMIDRPVELPALRRDASRLTVEVRIAAIRRAAGLP